MTRLSVGAWGTVHSLLMSSASCYEISTYDEITSLSLSHSQYKLDNFSAENRQNSPHKSHQDRISSASRHGWRGWR